VGNRYLVVSDLHLADVEDHADGWKAHKSSRHVFDGDFAALIRDFAAREAPGGPLTLVLNGDVFDFDLVTAAPDPAPWPVSRSERRRGLDATEPKSAWKLRRILADHPVFVSALADFAAGGHGIVCVIGNHDRELHFLDVRRVLGDAVRAAAAATGRTLPDGDPVRYEPWFFHVPGEVYVEHGQQHDYYSSFQHVLSPVVDASGRAVLALPMGNLSNRYLMSRMGFFNPHAADFILNGFRYLAHWLRHYAFSRRSLVLPWFLGSLSVMARLLATRSRILLQPRDLAARTAEVAARNGVTPGTMAALARLQKTPITQRFFRIVREFWIDRLLMAFLMAGGTVALALVPIPLWIKLMVPLACFPLLYFVYEWLVREEGVHAIGKEIPAVARAIGDLLPVRVVTLGHSHVPRLVPLRGGLVFVDTGTWAPNMSLDDRRRKPGYRNFLAVAFDGARVDVRFECWDPVRPTVRRADRPGDLDQCHAVRRAVFVEEQRVPEAEEWDGKDGDCTHFLAFAGFRTLAGTARLRVDGATARAQRLAVLPPWRGHGVGRRLMDAVEAEAAARGCREVLADAQVQALPFYESLGYVAGCEVFLDAGIPHRRVRKSL